MHLFIFHLIVAHCFKMEQFMFVAGFDFIRAVIIFFQSGEIGNIYSQNGSKKQQQ